MPEPRNESEARSSLACTESIAHVRSSSIVKVTVLPGQSDDTEATRDGVTDRSYGPYSANIKINAALVDTGSDVQSDSAATELNTIHEDAS